MIVNQLIDYIFNEPYLTDREKMYWDNYMALQEKIREIIQK
jgi:hypothetical protein